MSFDKLGLSEKVLAAVAASGYTNPTPIQEQAIPHVLERRDIVGIAQTGTGKTASFVLPMLTLLESGRARARMPRTLILEPTRELAAQVEKNFITYGAQHKYNVALLIGGVSFDEQDRKLTRGADVLIATPGRLLDHFERGRLLLTGVEILVIDEGDRMLDMGFIPDIERICKLIPFTRQTLFFSATMPPEIQRLADAFLQAPVKIEVARQASMATTVTHFLTGSRREPHFKRQTLRSLIRDAENLKNAIVFCNRKRDVATVFRSLERHEFNVGALHGDMDQHARMATLGKFREGEITLLVASDVAARGLDIPDVSHVFNYDVPTHAEDYVHRVGRTGRAGRSGTAFTIVTPDEKKYVSAIEKLIGKEIVWSSEMPSESDGEAGEERPRNDRRRDRRPAKRSGGRGKASAPAAEPATDAASERAPERAPERASAPKPAPVERQPAKAAERPVERPAPRPSNDQSQNSRRDRNRRDRGGDREPPVVGLGDHVPAFLLRPVRPAKTDE